ncbi:FAD/NAD(P)-binding protein [Novosphingobium sp. 9]|uniref:FAD/NAD(P)-binding protein n=1 Tax=Novosphingobium sp. 9 TaxID=2025349 RepID=UPI0021B516B0|nr:FAD/NAD(P)-binding protein [Novosphingobium sp. 9]
MNRSLAFVGAGPTAIYTLHALLDQAPPPFALTIFEKQASIGRGTPYRPGWNDPAMLSNIASVEIPALEEPLVAWLARQDDERLKKLHISRDEINDRTFFPRVVLGEYFHEQFQAILDRAGAMGIRVTVQTRCDVLDAVSTSDGLTLSVRPPRGGVFTESFDHVVLATGHQWPAEPEVCPGYFISPWPASRIAKIAPCHVGIRGSSLTAIDAAVALALGHGDFMRGEDGVLRYVAGADTRDFRMTMLSRKGLLPEADFYFPIPYEPLSICTRDAIAKLIERDSGNLLEKTFSLFKRELVHADPSYAKKVGLEELDMDGFCDAYFAERMASDPFEWAQANLEEARANYAVQHTVAWRYAILRMHEVIEDIVPHLSDEDFGRFSSCFKTIFVDDYATVPHESIERMLALHRAGKLDVLAVGEEYHLDTHSSEGGVILHVGGQSIQFPAFIEATGQRALAADDFPFSGLCEQGIIRDVADPDAPCPSRGIVIDDEFHPISLAIPEDQLFCLSLPFIMGRHPFIQGITSSCEMGKIVAPRLAAALASDAAALSNNLGAAA